MHARTEGVTWRTIDAQVVILDLETSCYLRTNSVGTLLWERLQTECTTDDLAALLVETFGIDMSIAAKDAAQFVQSMAENNLLSGSDAEISAQY